MFSLCCKATYLSQIIQILNNTSRHKNILIKFVKSLNKTALSPNEPAIQTLNTLFYVKK